MKKQSKDIYSMTFKRKCSVNFYKNLKLRLGEMSFSKNWIDDTRGDMYPQLEKKGNFRESLEGFCYKVNADEAFCTERLLGQYFPYANYEMHIKESDCRCGFVFRSTVEKAACEITVGAGREGKARITCEHFGAEKTHEEIETEITFGKNLKLIVECLGNSFFVYLQEGEHPVYVGKTLSENMKNIQKMSVFNCSSVSVVVKSERGGNAALENVEFYLDCGISQADMRPIRYEDGTPYIENGKVFFTMSSRLQESQYQSVISWLPSTCRFALEGAIFYDAGDDVWANDVAASVLYNRNEGIWQLWVCSFSHGHMLAHGTSKADLRYGINVVDVELMPTLDTQDDTLFAAKENDEDPDFVYDKEKNKWYMTICRLVQDESGTNYRYFMYESDKPFEGYKYVTHSRAGSETGGSIVKIAGKYYFVCGSNFDLRAMYHIYPMGDFSEFTPIKCDFDDGGFRGWGTIVPVPCGNRTKYAWLTFDRHGGSDWNWSYGNMYVYESDIMNFE